ncbi:hypothetical protein P3102_09535 [Amycolatopsis sp. QT-25]|uniref:hypothetical protein n=1 Tax=Amycolatopsis sp. QT-25 TaxID=3034022 RepID=UPI0023EB430C|nr:hypothetical protein [Amycolatopsis sp. QT-25]WET81430.1 hypothetical protein P3102_09535 [Amycolatopsis sp. QT-25]
MNRPYRWDLVRPDQLGTLLERAGKPWLWFLDELIECAAKVIARAGDADLYFVGRSADSVYDLLSGTPWRERIHRLPLSFAGARDGLTAADVAQLRANLAEAGLSPHDLARGRPKVFVDLVHSGHTFTELYRLLRAWIDDEREAWSTIRGRLRFLGITIREKTAPSAFRWQQHFDWPAELPANGVRNISLDWPVWYYFGDRQEELTASFPRPRWSDENGRAPEHSAERLRALAEAVAIVEVGRSKAARDLLVRHLRNEPAMAESWLRTLIMRLR